MENTACIFCRRTGAEVKITQEHTFSDWIGQVLQPAIVGPKVTYERSFLQGPRAGTVNTWSMKIVADHTLRNVCTDCNSGWMCKSEEAVRPLIEPMIKGRPSRLTVEQQITVATWAAMKAAVFEYVWSDSPVLSGADREIIMTHSRPPASARVRLAAVETDEYPVRAWGVSYERLKTGELLICLTLTIGCLVVQVVGGPGAETQGLLTAGKQEVGSIDVFPPQMRPVSWPPPKVLDDKTVLSFAKPLGDVSTTDFDASGGDLRLQDGR